MVAYPEPREASLASSVLCRGITYPVSKPIARFPPNTYLLAVAVSPVGTDTVPVATDVTALLLETYATCPVVHGDVVPRAVVTPEPVMVIGDEPSTSKPVHDTVPVQETEVVARLENVFTPDTKGICPVVRFVVVESPPKEIAFVVRISGNENVRGFS